jgi:trehalose/maltose hydrolase-like predicted phosphorylase
VLVLFYLLSAEELRGLLERLGHRLEPAAIRRNVDYYLRRTSHGSTLSGVVNAWVLARSDRPRSWSAGLPLPHRPAKVGRPSAD